jgi:hypothetical protein
MCSSVTTSLRDGSTGTPPRRPERCFRPAAGNASPRQCGKHLTRRAALALRQFLGRL